MNTKHVRRLLVLVTLLGVFLIGVPATELLAGTVECNPCVTIKKEVSVDGGLTWADANPVKTGDVPLQDDFNDGNANEWTVVPSGAAAGWSVNSGVYRYDGTNRGSVQSYRGDATWTDYTFEVNFQLGSPGQFPGGIRGRIDPTTGAGYVAWLRPDLGWIQLYRATAWNIDNPGLTLLGQASGIVIDTNMHKLALRFEGTLIEVYYDGNKVISSSDSVLTEGPVALDVSILPIGFDNVKVTRTQLVCPANAPGVGDQGAQYRLIVKNCGNAQLDYVKITDEALGIFNQLIPSVSGCQWQNNLEPYPPPSGCVSEMTITCADKGFENLCQPDRCVPPDPPDKLNTAQVTATVSDYNCPLSTISAQDSACVKCVECKGRIGDFAWIDTNKNGCQDTNEPGLVGVVVKLYRGACGLTGTQIGSTITDTNGYYEFTGLCAGDYQVVFDTPAGFEKTTPNVCDFDDGKDSDCTGQPICVTLPTDASDDITIDCGYVPVCPLVVDKKCFVEPLSPGPFVCDDAKPIDSMTVIWNGPQAPVYVKAWNGSVGTGTAKTFGPIDNGGEVTFTRSGTFPNDIYFEIFSNSAMTTKVGDSTFHLSCSDDDMDGREDCGKVAGDGKAKGGYQNWWIFEGMAGRGQVLDCTPAPVGGADACSFVAPPPPDCETLGKPKSLTFLHTGAVCGASDNSQAADKWACSGVPGTGTVGITIVKDPARIMVSPSSVNVGDLVTVSLKPGQNDMGSEIQLMLDSSS